MYTVVTDYELINYQNWENFILHHPNGNVFFLPEMLRLYRSTPGHKPVFIACLDGGGQIIGIITGVIQSSKCSLLKPLTSRCIVWGGPLIQNDFCAVADLLLHELDKIVSKKVIYVQFRNFWDINALESVFNKYKFQKEDHLDIHINLGSSKDTVWGKIKSNAKNKIHKGERLGLKMILLNTENDIKGAYGILKEVYKRISLPLADEQFFINAFNILGINRKLYFFGAYLGDELISIRIVLAFRGILYDWYAGSKTDFQNYNANDFLVWKILEWGIGQGYTIFDFGGAGKPDEKYGVRDYKMKFGGVLVNYGRLNKTYKPLLFFTGKTLLRLFQIIRSYSAKKSK